MADDLPAEAVAGPTAIPPSVLAAAAPGMTIQLTQVRVPLDEAADALATPDWPAACRSSSCPATRCASGTSS